MPIKVWSQIRLAHNTGVH